MEQLPQERLQIGVTAAAHAEAMFELTRDWVIQRKVFGGRVADLQTVKHKLAAANKTMLANGGDGGGVAGGVETTTTTVDTGLIITPI